MHVKLVQIGNSMGLRLPKSLIKQYELDKGEIELKIQDEGIMIVSTKKSVAPSKDWDRLFTEAKAAGFDPDEDAIEFEDWDVTLTDGIDD